ncbi:MULTISPECIES: helix-turn-helix domain-containing protein [unclassified Rhizobium]|uniref:helix-turn-helix domain-containing protein n=1 Tax=unclassified Rhizobium TaxID=2613769 RepID=UPI001FEDE36C|nr:MULTISPECIES: AraC family transcriptional regulator [unclassified Rhizobium]
MALLTHLVQTYGSVSLPARKKGYLAPWQEKRATEFLAAHINRSFSLAELASACSLSKSYFTRAFKETCGKTPYRWLLEYRVTRAKDLLLTDTPIADIAKACGFADQSHMTRVFSEIIGEAPGGWRRRNRFE